MLRQRPRSDARILDCKVEDVWPRVVADDVEIKLYLHEPTHIDVGSNDRFLAVDRPCQELAHWAHDAAAAADRYVGQVLRGCNPRGGIVRPREKLAAAEHEAAALARDVLHRRDPRIPVIDRRRAVD